MIERISRLPPWMIILSSSVTAVLMTQEETWAATLGVSLLLVLSICAFISPWQGVLGIFPLIYMLKPTPQSIGFIELSFALLLAIVFVRAFMVIGSQKTLVVVSSIILPMATVGIIALINYIEARSNGVPVSDWIRGVTPFLFVLMFIPIGALVSGNQERIFWLAASIGALIVLFVGHVLWVYISERLWEYIWYRLQDGRWVRITQEMAEADPTNAQGPYIERVTMKVQQSTDALLPLGLSTSYIIFVFARKPIISLLAMLVSTLAITAILVTYTRSMLLSSFIVLASFFIYLLIYHRQHLRRSIAGGAFLAIFSVVTILGFGLETVWLNRALVLTHTAQKLFYTLLPSVSDDFLAKLLAHHNVYETSHSRATLTEKEVSEKEVIEDTPMNSDANVTTRIEEYRVAWTMFLEHPLFGNGLGIKHDMKFVTSPGNVLEQKVGYVHNWPLYTLMTGGILGFGSYAWFLLGLIGGTGMRRQPDVLVHCVMYSAIATLAIYGLFFAVFRLISFNLLLAAAWGIAFAGILSNKYEANK